MFKNYLLITIRNLSRQRGFAIINIGGLAVGMAAFVLISLFVQNELGYDQHHVEADQLYRVMLDAEVMGQAILTINTPTPLAETLVGEVPGVVSATRVDESPRILVEYDDKQFYEDQLFLVDSTIFDVLSYEFSKGDRSSALTRPNTIVVSEDAAARYFGEDDPIGKTITVDNRTEYEVIGVFQRSVGPSHFRPELLGSMVSSERATDGVWLNNTLSTYVRLDGSSDPAAIEAVLPGIVRKYVGPSIERVMGGSFDEALSAGLRYDFRLEPVTDIYLRSTAADQLDVTGDIRYVYILIAIGAFVLLIACVNFINLSTARSTGRAREVGLRKVLGSGRKQLIQQFMGESTIVVIISMILSLGLATAALPWFNRLAGTDLQVGPWLFVVLGLVAVVTGVLAGFYPAIVLSRFRPATVLRGTFSRSAGGSLLRSSLVVFQFSISIILIVGTAIVYKQLTFMHQRDLGFQKDQVVVLPVETMAFAENFESFRHEVLKHSGIVNVAGSNMLPGPGHTHNNTAFRPQGQGNEQIFLSAFGRVSPEFVATLGLQIVAGRDFSKDFETDVSAYVISETAAKEAGWTAKEAVGKSLARVGGGDDDTDIVGEVIGVFGDAHFSSLHEEIGPRILAGYGDPRYLPIRIRPEQTQEAIEFLETAWVSFEPGYPFRYFFLDQDFARFYDQEERLVQIMGYFTLLAILISCLGLFGLSSFITAQRTKEIGVRKVLGASVGSVVLLLSKDFTRLVLIAAVIAFPIAYIIMKSWLEDFAYATEMGWIVFATTAVISLLVAWSTVSWQSIRAAISDPVRSLRYE
jgi:putative ABC transport system permease protein